MRYSIHVACILTALLSNFISCRPQKGIIAPGAKLEKLAGDFQFTEGPASDINGNVFFTDQPTDRIMKYGIDGTLSVFMQPSGRSNGLSFDRAGNLWACADNENQLWLVAPNGQVTVITREYQGKLLNGPNDVWIHPGRGVYFTDPFYQRPYWHRSAMEQEGQYVYYLAPDRQNLIRVIDDLVQPNGIIGTPDGQVLYVADIGAGQTFSYHIQKDGTLSDKKLFCPMGSDGLTIDSEGNVYLTGKGVTVFDRTGKQIAHIEVAEPWTANVCFGGRDLATLFITASTGLYGMHMRTHGVGSQ
jgi:gluconolactonase